MVRAPSSKMLARKADEYEMVRQSRLAIDKEAKKLKDKETELKTYLQEGLKLSGAQGIKGAKVAISLTEDEIPIIEDAETFRKYINRTKRFDLAQSLKPSSKAIKEMWDAGKEVPGITVLTRENISRSKV